MKTMIAASLIALTTLASAPALAQTTAASAPAAASAETTAGLSVDKTPIGDIIKNEKAKAALEAALPPIAQYYDQISGMTLAQVAPMSQGAIDDAKLKSIQAEFDKINAGK